MNKKTGFTLIELLVVIAIIALLMSVLLPALSKAKENAKRVICGTRIRQVITGLHAYAQSNDDLLPSPYLYKMSTDAWATLAWRSVFAFDFPVNNPPVSDPTPRQLGVLYSAGFIDNPEVFYCPSQPRNGAYPFPYYYDYYTGDGNVEWGAELFPSQGPSGTHWAVRTSYNYWVLEPDQVNVVVSKTADMKIRLAKLSNMPILFDNCQEWEVLPHRKNDTTPQGISVAFSDGHVSFSKSDYLFSDELWPKDFSSYWNGPGDRAPFFQRILEELKRLQ